MFPWTQPSIRKTDEIKDKDNTNARERERERVTRCTGQYVLGADHTRIFGHRYEDWTRSQWLECRNEDPLTTCIRSYWILLQDSSLSSTTCFLAVQTHYQSDTERVFWPKKKKNRERLGLWWGFCGFKFWGWSWREGLLWSVLSRKS